MTATVTLEGVTVGSVAITASVDEDALAGSGLPAGSTVTSAELAVTVVPPPVHLQLAFKPSALTVEVGAAETAVLSLPGVPAGAAVRVELSAPVASTRVLVVTPDEVLFTATTASQVVTITGATEGSITVTADVFDTADLPPNSSVLPAELAVMVILPTVALQLAFDPPALDGRGG